VVGTAALQAVLYDVGCWPTSYTPQMVNLHGIILWCGPATMRVPSTTNFRPAPHLINSPVEGEDTCSI
jgi:hypothetical protein